MIRSLCQSCVVVASFAITFETSAVPLTIDVVESGSSAPVVDAVVYAVSANGPSRASRRDAASVEISQVDKTFVPHVTVVQTGTAIAFPNRDSVRHHVYSFSPAKTFELKLYKGTPSDAVVFDKSGLVTLGCNIHDEMLAFVLVVDTPYFTRSDATGVAMLDVPSGDWIVHAWHPRVGEAESGTGQAVTLKRDPMRVRTELRLAPPR